MKSEPPTRRRGQAPQHGLSLYSDNQGKHDGGGCQWGEEQVRNLWRGVRQALSRAADTGLEWSL